MGLRRLRRDIDKARRRTFDGCSWLNMVEIFFGIITRHAIRRGTFRSVKELTAAIGRFIDAYNDWCEPFAWTKDADELLAKVRPPKVRPATN